MWKPLMPLNKGNSESASNKQALPPAIESGQDRAMPQKALLTGEAAQTIGFGGAGLAFVGLMLIGGWFVAIGLALALVCSVVIVILHWQELRQAIRTRTFTRHLVLPLAVVILVPVVGLLVANKDALQSLAAPTPTVVASAPPPAQIAPPSSLVTQEQTTDFWSLKFGDSRSASFYVVWGAFMMLAYGAMRRAVFFIARRRAKQEMASTGLFDYYHDDFMEYGGPHGVVTYSAGGEEFEIAYRCVFDFQKNAKFAMFYFPAGASQFIDRVAEEHIGLLERATQATMSLKTPSDHDFMNSADMVFSGRVFIYHEDLISIADLGRADLLFKQRATIAVFRGPDYLRNQLWLDHGALALQP